MNLDYNIDAGEIELIEKYLQDQLEAGEKELFNKKMNTDSHWTKKINETRLLLIGLKESQLQESINGFHAALDGQTKAHGLLVSFNKRWMIAASLLIAVSIAAWFVLNDKNKYEELYADYFIPDPGLLTAMGPATNYPFEKGMVEYKNEEYEKALQTWKELTDRGQSTDTLHFFIGMANQALGRDAVAKQYLQKISTNDSHAFYSDACWYLGLLHLKEKQTGAAIALIVKSNHPKKAELLDAIKKN